MTEQGSTVIKPRLIVKEVINSKRCELTIPLVNRNFSGSVEYIHKEDYIGKYIGSEIRIRFGPAYIHYERKTKPSQVSIKEKGGLTEEEVKKIFGEFKAQLREFFPLDKAQQMLEEILG